VKLPENEEDGALPKEQVFLVLELSNVQVVHLDDLENPGQYRTILKKDQNVIFQSFTDKVPRETIRYIARKFGIPALHFYFPKRHVMN